MSERTEKKKISSNFVETVVKNSEKKNCCIILLCIYTIHDFMVCIRIIHIVINRIYNTLAIFPIARKVRQ